MSKPVQHATKTAFSIPKFAKNALLPNPGLTIDKFLQFPLPPKIHLLRSLFKE